MNIYLAINKINLPAFIDKDMRGVHYSEALHRVYAVVENGNCNNVLVDSPYTLYAFNNCQMAHIVWDKIKERERIKTPIPKSPLKFFSIDNKGDICDISNEDGTIKDSDLELIMKRLMDDFYLLLNYYGE